MNLNGSVALACLSLHRTIAGVPILGSNNHMAHLRLFY